MTKKLNNNCKNIICKHTKKDYPISCEYCNEGNKPQKVELPDNFCANSSMPCPECRVANERNTTIDEFNEYLKDKIVISKEKLEGLRDIIYDYLKDTQIGGMLNGRVDCMDISQAIITYLKESE